MLIDAGHDVVGTCRRESHLDVVRGLGAEPVVMDGLDRASVAGAVEAARPDVVVHQLTALTGATNPRRFAQEFALTNRLRTEATDHLLAAARAVGAQRFVAQSFTGWTNPRSGSPVKGEDAGLDPQPTAVSAETLAAIAYLERTVAEARDLDGVVLRYGLLYGPGTDFDRDGAMAAMIRSRRLPVIGGGAGVWSFVHVDDAASATLAAVTHRGSGLFNIVDDEPVAAAEWLPAAAQVMGAKPPRRVPGWLVRPLVGEQVISMMTRARGSSNARAKAELGWSPVHTTWRQGFAEVLAPERVAS
jgi:nucleoside-diphosphate-sugar epimerase